jgi:hypothetical protein
MAARGPGCRLAQLWVAGPVLQLPGIATVGRVPFVRG